MFVEVLLFTNLDPRIYGKGAESYTDEWGIDWRNASYETRFGTGFYTDIVGHPLAANSAIDTYCPPNSARRELYTEAERLITKHKDEYWIVGVTVTTIFETAWALRGFERMLIDFSEDPDLADVILDIPFRYHLAAARRLADFGTQQGMLISPRMWRRFFKPRMAEMFSCLKAVNPEIKIAITATGISRP